MSAVGKSILVIEDDFFIRETLRELLESEAYVVTTAENGKDGLEKLRGAPKPSLVLLDMMMPVMDGREFLNIVSADAALAPIPVLVVSAVADRATSQGAVGYIKKPIDVDVLLGLVALYADATNVAPKCNDNV